MPALPSLGSALNAPAISLKTQYVGIALLVAWHYSLWFVPNAVSFLGMMSIATTYAWLLTLAFSALSLFIIPLALRGKRHLSDHPWVSYISPIALSTCTMLLCLTDSRSSTFMLTAIILSLTIGVSSSALWILWSEHYARNRAAFEISNVAPAFAVTLLLALLINSMLPPLSAALFVSTCPLLSGLAYRRENRRAAASRHFPSLLSATPRKKVLKSVGIICLIGATLSIVCSFVGAIIPTSTVGIDGEEHRLTWVLTTGFIAVSVTIMLYVLVCRRKNPHTAIPFLLIFGIIAIVLFLRGSAFCSYMSFSLALGTCSMLEILLLTYFGSLSSKGYFAPAFSFGLALGVARFGVLIGDGIAVALEQNDAASSDLTQILALASICLLSFLLIPLIHQEYTTIKLSSAPPSDDQIDAFYESIVEDFGLSTREGDVLKHLARNCSVEYISKKLVISPYTVQTHVSHIYRKMDVHKRSELIEYIDDYVTRA